MCLLAVLYRMTEDAPVVIGANREEHFARPGEPPQFQSATARFLAGRDPQEGGTWLGLNEHGLIVAVTNRRITEAPENPRSRGLLVRDLLGCPGASVATGMALTELAKKRYRGCNLFLADADNAIVIQAADWLRVHPLPPGIHVITNTDLNSDTDPRSRHAMEWLSERVTTRSEDCLELLKELCSQTGEDSAPMCLREENRGTVSSSLIALRWSLSESSYWHAQGPPDVTEYEDVSELIGRLGEGVTS